ncbi:MAG: Pycsar system effector family protein [Novosphingobium sp.]
MESTGQGAAIVPIKDQGEAPRIVATPSMPSPTGFSNHAIHLVRTLQQMELSLSQMADQKASILMGATFLVFTISVGQAKNGSVPVALAVLALFAFGSALCAVFAVLPKISNAKRNVGGTNKLFFGFFTAMDESEWTEQVLQDLRADETVFRAMLHDIYQNGQVLQRKKYKYLGYAYRVFITGMCATVATFIVEMIRAHT